MSLAREHFQRTIAARNAKAAANRDDDTMEDLTAYEQQLGLLQQRASQLKNIQGTERKVALKVDFIGEFDPYVDGVLAEAPGVQDEVLVTQMIWRLDAGRFDGAYEIACYALEHGLNMPERFNRTLPTYVAEDFSEASIEADGVDGKDGPSLGILLALVEDLKDADMPDPVRAKLHKAIAFGLEATGDQEKQLKAVEHYDRALELFSKVGVKGRRSKLVKALEQATSTD